MLPAVCGIELGHPRNKGFVRNRTVIRLLGLASRRSGARMQPTASAVGDDAIPTSPQVLQKLAPQVFLVVGHVILFEERKKLFLKRMFFMIFLLSRRCMRQSLSPHWGSPLLVAYLRLTPWAAFLRRFAASLFRPAYIY